jgi:hypothetical protein
LTSHCLLPSQTLSFASGHLCPEGFCGPCTHICLESPLLKGRCRPSYRSLSLYDLLVSPDTCLTALCCTCVFCVVGIAGLGTVGGACTWWTWPWTRPTTRARTLTYILCCRNCRPGSSGRARVPGGPGPGRGQREHGR